MSLSAEPRVKGTTRHFIEVKLLQYNSRCPILLPKLTSTRDITEDTEFGYRGQAGVPLIGV